MIFDMEILKFIDYEKINHSIIIVDFVFSECRHSRDYNFEKQTRFYQSTLYKQTKMIYRQIEKTDRQKCYKGRQTGIKDSQTDKREMDRTEKTNRELT